MNEQNKKLLNLLMRLEGLLHRHMAVGRQRTFMNPHRGQGRVLSILKLKPEITQKELTYLLDMSKQALGELLKKLENCGYITRTPSREDGRVMIIRLTEKGKTESDEMAVDNDDTEDLFRCLTDEEQKNLMAYLERLIQAWQIGDGMDRRRMGRRRAEAFRTAQRSDDERMGFGFQHFDESEPFKGGSL